MGDLSNRATYGIVLLERQSRFAVRATVPTPRATVRLSVRATVPSLTQGRATVPMPTQGRATVTMLGLGRRPTDRNTSKDDPGGVTARQRQLPSPYQRQLPSPYERQSRCGQQLTCFELTDIRGVNQTVGFQICFEPTDSRQVNPTVASLIRFGPTDSRKVVSLLGLSDS